MLASITSSLDKPTLGGEQPVVLLDVACDVFHTALATKEPVMNRDSLGHGVSRLRGASARRNFFRHGEDFVRLRERACEVCLQVGGGGIASNAGAVTAATVSLGCRWWSRGQRAGTPREHHMPCTLALRTGYCCCTHSCFPLPSSKRCPPRSRSKALNRLANDAPQIGPFGPGADYRRAGSCGHHSFEFNDETRYIDDHPQWPFPRPEMILTNRCSAPKTGG